MRCSLSTVASRLVLRILFTVPLLDTTGCKKVTETVVERGVKAAKDTAKGIEEGVEKGRKQGQSVDDALIVSRSEDLKGAGNLSLHAVRQAGDAAAAEVEIAVENTTVRPLRVTSLEVLALDRDGFVRRPISAVPELTVPPKAKDLLTIRLQPGPRPLVKVRIWGNDYDVPGV